MLAGLNEKIAAACRPLHARKAVTTREVSACLKAMRQLLLKLEVAEPDIAVFVERVLDAVSQEQALKHPDAASHVETIIQRVLAELPATAHYFKENRKFRLSQLELTDATRWDLKELQNHLPPYM